jgi:hypothetical protein
MASSLSLSGHKRSHAEQEIDSDCTCVVCFEVLLDPVTLPCGLDQRCLQRLAAAGQRACPTCRQMLPAVKFSVSVLLRNLVQQRYPEQVPISNPLLLKGGRWTRHGHG